MLQSNSESKTLSPRERELIVAYLSYALDDVRALSEVGSHLLQMTIATLNEEMASRNSGQPLQSSPAH
jgi:alkylhydroperoxidase/carboxymuconolactone decarboxylase family protein YurZ